MSGGNSSVSMVSATAGRRASARAFGAFGVVHITSSSPVHRKPIGTTRGVSSLAT
jgi:hypothetical protein